MVYSLTSPVLWWDEAVYSSLGFDLSKNVLSYSFNNGWTDFIPCGLETEYCWPKAGFRAPLLPYLLSLFYLFNSGFLIFSWGAP
jgi:hypothetical protein